MGVLDQVPLLYVALDGRDAPADLTRRVLSLEVDEHEKKATKITLELDDPDGELREGTLLHEGSVLGVRWGYPGGLLSAPRGGIVHKLEPSYAEDTVKVEAFGRELELSSGPVRRTFRGKTFREAVGELAREAGLGVRWEAQDTIRFDGQLIDNEHAWQWILRQSAALGLEVLLEGGELVVREPRLGEQAALVLHYRWRNAEILSFEVETDTKKRQREDEGVVALFFDPASGQVLSHAAGDPNTTRATLAARRVEAESRRIAATRAAEAAGLETYVRQHPELAGQGPEAQRAAYARERSTTGTRPTEDDEALLVRLGDSGNGQVTPAPRSSPDRARAQAAPQVVAADRAAAEQHVRRVAEGSFRARERGKVKAKCTCLGLPRVRCGQLVQVVGVAARDAGLWFVAGCTHKLDSSGYETELALKRDGVNGRAGRRPAAAARQNATGTQGAAAPGQAEPMTAVRLEDGREV